jgi:Mg2+/citrate symporter
MSDKTVVSAKMGNRTVERLEEYAEEEGISRSQATERMAKQGLDVEESDMRLIPVKTDGGTRIENTLNQTQQTLESQSEKLDEQQSIQTGLNLVLTLSILWLGVHTILSVAPVVTVGTGIVLVSGLVYTYYQYLRD